MFDGGDWLVIRSPAPICSLADISPYGKVPVLVVEEGHIHESAAINQYIDEKWGKSGLMG